MLQFIKYVEYNLFRTDDEICKMVRNETIQILKSINNRDIKSFENNIRSFKKEVKRFISENPEILITRADKGNTTVIMNRESYRGKMYEILNDQSTYILINKDPTNKITTEISNLLKIEKTRGTLISCINSAFYPLATFLKDIIDNNFFSTIKIKILENRSNLDKNNSNLKKKFFIISYLSKVSEKFKKLSHIQGFNIAYKLINKMNRFIKTGKEPLRKEDHCGVVYKINCLNCEFFYIGQTKRKLKTRIKEHRAGIRSSTSEMSVVSRHQPFLDVLVSKKADGTLPLSSAGVYKIPCSTKQCIDRHHLIFGDETSSNWTVYNWFAEFQRGRTFLCDEFREGRPSTSVVATNVEAVSLGIDMKAIHILHDHLNVRKLCNRWISHNLIEAQKAAKQMIAYFFSYTGLSSKNVELMTHYPYSPAHVIRMKSTDSLPFPVIMSSMIVSCQWFAYGCLLSDQFIQIPNFMGCILSAFQLSLFLIYPSKRIDQAYFI
ncbi:SWET1 protein, partial [Acromyrmex insinuator]